jgi:deazaflavin-dependent oxidoreductase (nitroreductase family)
MLRFVRRFVLVILALGGIFLIGMRRKWSPVLDAVRWTGRAFRPFVLRTAGTEGASASVVRHVGRRSGHEYETPVVAVPTPDGFAIALPYGPNTDWLKNVLALGSATLVTEGAEHKVEQPLVVPVAEVDEFFRPKEQRLHRQFSVATALRVRAVEEYG